LLILSTWGVWYWFLQQGGWGPLRLPIPFRSKVKRGKKRENKKTSAKKETLEWFASPITLVLMIAYIAMIITNHDLAPCAFLSKVSYSIQEMLFLILHVSY
jgi:hypothetical protein